MTDKSKGPDTSRMSSMDEDQGDGEEGIAMEVDMANPMAGLDSKALEVLRGSLESLPRLPTKTVRIFLSSTFSDFKAERNILPKLAYPELLSYCSDLGLEFQVVDMRWGVTDDAINDHQVSALCLQEIMTCQQVSCGPNFVVLLGNRYGWQPFPATVEATMFEEFRKIAEEKDLPQWELLVNWFIRDDNAVPPQYNLQPIHKFLKYYSDMTRDALREQDRERWSQVFVRLRTLLRECATIARQRGIIEAEVEKRFYISVTEEEMGQGVFGSERPEQQILCYMRDLHGIEENYPQSELFIDVDEQGSIDAFAQGLRRELHQKKLPMVLPESNIKKYKVKWTGTPLEESRDFEHQTYLERFCTDFVHEMKNLIDMAYEDHEDEEHQLVTTIYHEALHHARFAKVKCEVFCGRDEELKFIQRYLQDPRCPESRCYPFVIYGKSGIGKTALLAKAAYHCPEWLGPSAVTILRFFGTSPQSSNISDALKSMIFQICINFGYRLPKEETLENFGDIRREFWELLERTGQEVEVRPLVLILDSVDQLLSNYGAHNMIWLPKAIPRNVYLITAMLSERFGCLESSRKRFMNCPNFLQLDCISTETGSEIIDLCLRQANRELTCEQRELVKQVFEQNPQPLFLKLLMDNARTWQSYTKVTANELGSSVHAAITKLFEQLELKYGRTFVRHALGYLTCGKVGLTDVEMEDALSCDDKVLVEVYQYHDPPLEGMIRIPPLLWARLQHALKEYLADRQVDGKVVQAWYHRQFWETAEQRYLASTEEVEARHGVLAEIFLQENGVCRTIVLEQRAGKVIENANRRVTPQPLSARNKRKLNALPYHFICGSRINDLKERCLLNFEWLLIKLLSVNISMVTKEYTLMCEGKSLKGHDDVELFRNFLDLCFDSLWHDPYLLAYHVKERLSRCSNKSPLLEKMVRDATLWLSNTHIPTLVPTHVLNLASPDSPLRFNILVGYDGILSDDETMMACYWSETNCPAKIQVLNLTTKDLVASVQTERKAPFALTHDSRFFITFDSNILKICDLDGGDLVSSFPYFDGDYDKMYIKAMALNSTSKKVIVSVKLGKPKNLSPYLLWEAMSMLYLIDIAEKKTVDKSFEMKGRTNITRLFFTPDDRHVISLTKDRIFIHSMERLADYESLDELGDVKMHLFSLLPEAGEAGMLVGPVSQGEIIKLLLLNCSDNVITISQGLHDEPDYEAFHILSQPDGSRHLVGLMNKVNCLLCTWDTRSDEMRTVKVPIHGLKGPSTFTATSDWSQVFIGWNSGYISFVDMAKEEELHSAQCHGQVINYMKMLSNSSTMITISQDHSFKMWDTSRWVALVQSKLAKKANGDVSAENGDKTPVLDENEQCLDVVASSSYVITAPKETLEGPRYWNIENGELDREMTENHTRSFEASWRDVVGQLLPEGSTHANLELVNDEILMYTRKRRDIMTMCVSDPVGEPNICGHQVLLNAFISITPRGRVFTDTELLTYVVLEGKLNAYSLPNLDEMFSIDIPSILKEVGHITNNAGRRRLGFYRVGITTDRRYFLIANPGGTYRKNDRYFDLIDLEEKCHACRVKFPKHLSATLMENSITFLVQKEETVWAIYPPSILEEVLASNEFSYRLIYNGKFMSEDGSLGIEFCNRYHSCIVWQINPLQRLHVLTNHTHQLTCCSISADNQYLVTGSYDKTVRVWSLVTGTQLCMFHTNGSAVQVLFNPPGKYVIVSCYAAPQKKRTIILKFQNCKGRRKLSRFISKYDLM